MKFRVQWKEGGGGVKHTSNTKVYPTGQTECIVLKGPEVPQGQPLWPRVTAIAGESKAASSEPVQFDNGSSQVATYDVTGGTMNVTITLQGGSDSAEDAAGD